MFPVLLGNAILTRCPDQAPRVPSTRRAFLNVSQLPSFFFYLTAYCSYVDLGKCKNHSATSTAIIPDLRRFFLTPLIINDENHCMFPDIFAHQDSVM